MGGGFAGIPPFFCEGFGFGDPFGGRITIAGSVGGGSLGFSTFRSDQKEPLVGTLVLTKL
jgi:hypothetical protein